MQRFRNVLYVSFRTFEQYLSGEKQGEDYEKLMGEKRDSCNGVRNIFLSRNYIFFLEIVEIESCSTPVYSLGYYWARKTTLFTWYKILNLRNHHFFKNIISKGVFCGA